MIHRIYSNLPSFKELTFHEGLNILLSDKTPEATNLQTRNRAGKTSMIEIVHFLLGSDCDPDSIFRCKSLIKSSFGMEFDLNKSNTCVERFGEKPSDIQVIFGSTSDLPISVYTQKKSGQKLISNTNWKINLGFLMFGLSVETKKEDQSKFTPTFRSLFGYFARRQSSDAFTLPEKNAAMQQLWDQQVAISFLLGLDWTIPQRWQMIREKERTLRELKKSVGEGVLEDIIGTSAELRTKLAVADEKVRKLREDISSFNVLLEYKDLEKEASYLTQKISALSNENIIDNDLITQLKHALTEETPPAIDNLQKLYSEAGIVLSEAVIRRIDDVKTFHQTIIENRKSYLNSELQAAEQRIIFRESEQNDASKRRAEIWSLLNSHGALDQFNKLQTQLNKVESETESLRQKFNAAEQLEGLKTQLDVERSQLLFRLQQDYHEESTLLDRAIIAFQDISSALYEEAGSLHINPTPNGPTFDVTIQGAKSKGVSNMQIFCFDMMLMKLCFDQGIGPGFLIHDSLLFDGVDSRQKETALRIGAQMSEKYGFQYIVTMNSDDIPTEFNKEKYVLPVKLTDATETGGLFGIRF